MKVPTWLKALLIVLVCIVGIQTYYIFKVNRHLHAMNSRCAEKKMKYAKQAPSTNPQKHKVRALQQPVAPITTDPNGSYALAQGWDPFIEMQEMQNRMAALMHRMGMADSINPQGMGSPFASHFELEEDGHAYVAHIALPNVDDKTLQVSVQDQMLMVRGTHEELIEEKDPSGNLIRSQQRMEHFVRSMRLPAPVDPQSLKTSYQNGILTITVEKS